MAERRRRNLNKTQTELAEAAKEKQEDEMGMTGLGLETGVAKAVETGVKSGASQASPAVAKNIARGTRFMGSRFFPQVAALDIGMGIGSLLDKTFGYSDDIAYGLAKVQTGGGSGSQPALSEMERQAIAEGKNPLQPITQGRRGTVDFRPLPVTDDSLSDAAQEARQSSPFGASYLDPQGRMIGVPRAGGESREMTPEELQQFQAGMADAPIVSGYQMQYGDTPTDTPFERDGVFMNQAALEQFTPQAPEVPQAPDTGRSLLADTMLANFQRFKESGQEMTPEQVVKAQTLAASVGRTFDPEQGYSTEFDPAIMQAYREDVEAGRIPEARPQRETPEQPITREAREARLETEARRAAPSDPERFREFDERRRAGGLTITVGGEQVAATPENRAKRDLEKTLKEEAKAEGLRGAAARQYVRDAMQKREEQTEDRRTQQIMDDLNIEIAEANLLAKQQKLLEMPDGVSPSTLNSLQKFLADNDVSFDPETGALTTKNERFLLPDGTVNLAPDSPIMNILKGGESGIPIQGAELFLQIPPSVQAMAGQAKEGSYVRSDDGRVYQFVNGKFVHVA
jgi:ribosome-associated protein YbcJ (S4-like RNA binding protein)